MALLRRAGDGDGAGAAPNVILLSVRAMTYFCDAMPRAAEAVVRHGVLPVICSRHSPIEEIASASSHKNDVYLLLYPWSPSPTPTARRRRRRRSPLTARGCRRFRTNHPREVNHVPGHKTAAAAAPCSSHRCVPIASVHPLLSVTPALAWPSKSPRAAPCPSQLDALGSRLPMLNWKPTEIDKPICILVGLPYGDAASGFSSMKIRSKSASLNVHQVLGFGEGHKFNIFTDQDISVELKVNHDLLPGKRKIGFVPSSYGASMSHEPLLSHWTNS